MSGKWLQLLKEVAPYVSRVTVLFDPKTGPANYYYLGPIEAAARSLAITLKPAPVEDVADMESEIATPAREPDTGLLVLLAVASVIWWHYRPLRAFLRMRSDARGYS